MQNESILAFYWGDWPRPDPNGPQCGPLVSLSRRNKILVVESPLTVLSPFLRRNRNRKKYTILEKINSQLSVFTPLLLLPYHPRLPLPTWTKKLLNKINNPLISFQVKRVLKKQHISNPILWLSMLHPEDLIRRFRHKLVCALCYDEVSASPIFTSKQQHLIKEFEEKLLRKADVVFATSKRLYNNKIKLNPKTYLISNAIETEFINRINNNGPPALILKDGPKGLRKACEKPEAREKPKDIENIPSPLIGYIGKINIRLDFKLIYDIARNKQKWQFVFIGPVEFSADKYFMHRLNKLENVHFLGQKPHTEITRYLKHFDVLTIPFVINEYTKNMHPLKVYQYLASGKPVVSTNLPEVVGLSSTASSELEFIKLLDQALKETDPHLPKQRIEIARNNTWDKRSITISRIIDESRT